MRLFVAVWPDEVALRALSGTLGPPVSHGLRWVPERDWHVTVVFLGSVAGDDYPELVQVLRSVGPSLVPTTATLGPQTCVLGRGVLCTPVTGLEEIARCVREVTHPFNRSPDSEQPFFGHLTLARAVRGRRIPREAAGTPVGVSWPVSEVRLVSSEATSARPRYTAKEVVVLGP